MVKIHLPLEIKTKSKQLSTVNYEDLNVKGRREINQKHSNAFRKTFILKVMSFHDICDHDFPHFLFLYYVQIAINS